MKISEMGKDELVHHMRAARMLHSFDGSSPEWKRAFELAKKNGLEDVDMDCNKCRVKVLEWLQR